MSPRVTSGIDSPMGAAYATLTGRAGTRALLDLAQAAPRYPPAPEVIAHIGQVGQRADCASYVPSPGLPRLREAFAADLTRDYRAPITADQMVITAGCNQAFCLVAQVLTQPGDEVIEVLPYYFNYDMWLRMNGVLPRYLEPGPDYVPRPAAAEALITPRTRAIVLVSPSNPAGVAIPPNVLAGFAEVAARHDIALILDETYRSFRDTEEPAHHLFADPAWDRTVVSLHSFSKELAIPGYRVGAVIASPEVNREVAKLLDCVAICAPRIGQEAAWAGLTSATRWRAARAAEVADKRRRFASAMAGNPGGFELLALGGFFAWIGHPFPTRSSEDVTAELVSRYDTLVIAGTAFLPEDRRAFRASVGNLEPAEITEFAERLRLLGEEYRQPGDTPAPVNGRGIPGR